jgi:hypothetical protein
MKTFGKNTHKTINKPVMIIHIFQTYTNGGFQCRLSEYGYNLIINIYQAGNVSYQETIDGNERERIEVLGEQLEYDKNDVEEKLTNMFQYIKRSISGSFEE